MQFFDIQNETKIISECQWYQSEAMLENGQELGDRHNVAIGIYLNDVYCNVWCGHWVYQIMFGVSVSHI